MSYKLNSEEENPLWRQYMDELSSLSGEESLKYQKEVTLPSDYPSPDLPLSRFCKAYANYTEEEFLEKLSTDEEFNARWGTLK